MSHSDIKRPAILGGQPIRQSGPPGWPRNDEQIRSTFERLFESGDWGRYHGANVPELARRLSDYHGVEHVQLCCSGTSAVELALRGAQVAPGDEVILAGYDFKANFQNVLCLQAVPVLVDLLPSNWQLDPGRLANAITSKTRAIIASHLHGGIVEIAQIREVVGSRGITIIEDACQCPGAMIHGQRAGTLGDIGVLSFGGSKLLTSGRGGAVLTRRTDVIERIKRHVNRGNDAYPISELQAAVLIPQLEQLDGLNMRRGQAVTQLKSLLSEVPGLTFFRDESESILPAYYKVGLRYDSQAFSGLTREQFVTSLHAEGIAIDSGFRSLHLIHAARRFRAVGELIEATKADSGMLTLHHPVLLEEQSALEEIALAVKSIAAHASEIAACLPAC